MNVTSVINISGEAGVPSRKHPGAGCCNHMQSAPAVWSAATGSLHFKTSGEAGVRAEPQASGAGCCNHVQSAPAVWSAATKKTKRREKPGASRFS
jgi:hypothetical protein